MRFSMKTSYFPAELEYGSTKNTKSTNENNKENFVDFVPFVDKKSFDLNYSIT